MLEIRDARLTFHRGTADARVALAGLTLALGDGELAVVVGPNGSGKTTLLNAVAGTVKLDAGAVLIDGEDVTAWPVHARARLVARVFQDPAAGTAASMTIEENLVLAELRGRRRSLRPALTASRRRRYRDLLARLGLGLEDRLGAKVGLLSGGQRQSLALVMAVAATPRVLLLDEHTAALDPRTAAVVMEATARVVAAGEGPALTTVMVTHNMRQALDFGTRLLMMQEGRVALDAAGAARAALTLDDLLERFHRAPEALAAGR